MNKQDKIKKVIHAFKNSKLKTSNGEVVTDKNQTFAVLLTKFSSAMENPLLIDNYIINAL